MPPPISSSASSLMLENNQEVLIRYKIISPELKHKINSDLKSLNKNNFQSVFLSLRKFIATPHQVHHLIESIV